MPRRPMGGMLGIRAVMVAVGALLGTWLFVSGYVVLGGVLLVMAVLRAALVSSGYRRRQAMQARRAAFIAHRRARWSQQPPATVRAEPPWPPAPPAR